MKTTSILYEQKFFVYEFSIKMKVNLAYIFSLYKNSGSKIKTSRMLKYQKMEYRQIGSSGLLVSVLSFGLFTNSQSSFEENLEIVRTCLQNGVNYFDTNESYDNGQFDRVFGRILQELKVPRESIVISSKFWKAPDPSINHKGNLCRKHLRESVKHSLERLGVDYLDLLVTFKYDENTPMVEVCRAIHEIIEEGLVFYWSTSNWEAEQVFQAMEVCEELNLHKPIGAQNMYNMIERKQIEVDYRQLFSKYGYGLAAYSPLMGGYLTGKYLDTIPQGSRFNDSTSKVTGFPIAHLKNIYLAEQNLQRVNATLRELRTLAEEELNCTLAQLALAWVIRFQYTSTALIGARSVKQLTETLGAFSIYKRISPDLEKKINKILSNTPQTRKSTRSFFPYEILRVEE